MVQRSKNPIKGNKKKNSVHMSRNNIQTKKVKVFPTHKLERMHINGIKISSKGGHLTMMVLMNVLIDSTNMKKLMEKSIKEVIDKIKTNHSSSGVGKREGFRVPLNIRRIPCKSIHMVSKHGSNELVEEDEAIVDGFEFFKDFDGDLLSLLFDRNLRHGRETNVDQKSHNTLGQENKNTKTNSLWPTPTQRIRQKKLRHFLNLLSIEILDLLNEVLDREVGSQSHG